jgi:hypothetical protein
MGAMGVAIGVEELDEVGVQGDVAVVAELAQGDAQPVAVADDGDGVGLAPRSSGASLLRPRMPRQQKPS